METTSPGERTEGNSLLVDSLDDALATGVASQDEATDVPSAEDEWGFAFVRGSVYAVGPMVREIGVQYQELASPEAVACREKRDGAHRFHVTVVHRTSIVSNAGGEEGSSKRARLKDLLGRAADVQAMTPDQGAPEALWRPIPLYVYQTKGEHAAVAVALLFLPAELLLLQVKGGGGGHDS